MNAYLLNTLNPADCVHLAIDWQKCYAWAMGEFAAVMQQKTFAFSRELKKMGVPTIWVVYPKEEVMSDDKALLLPAHEASRMFSKNDEPHLAAQEDMVAVKWTRSAFWNPNLEECLLRNMGRTNLLMSGAFRDCCIDQTIKSAFGVSQDFNCLPVYDLVVPHIYGRSKTTNVVRRVSSLSPYDYNELVFRNKAYYDRKMIDGAYPPRRFARIYSEDVVWRLNDYKNSSVTVPVRAPLRQQEAVRAECVAV